MGADYFSKLNSHLAKALFCTAIRFHEWAKLNTGKLIWNGEEVVMVSLSTTHVESEMLRFFIQDHIPKVKSGDLNENPLKVRACIAHKQPLC